MIPLLEYTDASREGRALGIFVGAAHERVGAGEKYTQEEPLNHIRDVN